MISGRIFTGSSIARSEDWIYASVNFTVDIFQGGQELKRWNPLLRPLMFRLLPAMQRIAKHQATARRMLFPIFQARAEAEKEQGYQKPEDTIQWMQERSRHRTKFDFFEQSDVQLKLGLAAIHTTGTTLTHIIFDLAARPEYIEPLREEVRRVLEADHGALTKQGLSKLCLMDSFMKESQRLSPIAYCRFSFAYPNESCPCTCSQH